ncbi:MAG TPA: hypothetical protein VGG27_19930 [Magnetospirillaceae bacterium]|jgi:uncharacterized protein YjiS (DUF1127 family)
MFDRIFAYVQAARENRRLADEFASMTHRDYVDIGISGSDVPYILEENFKRLYNTALEGRLAARGQVVSQHRVA